MAKFYCQCCGTGPAQVFQVQQVLLCSKIQMEYHSLYEGSEEITLVNIVELTVQAFRV
jgi:hypothetical protein